MTVIGLTALGAAARADDRLPTIPPAQYSAEQKQAAEGFEAARKTAVFGPFEPMMHSPQLMSDARAMGDYLRFKSSIGNTLSELAILMRRANGPRISSGATTTRSPSRRACARSWWTPSPWTSAQPA